jgi:hypothetical protein
MKNVLFLITLFITSQVFCQVNGSFDQNLTDKPNYTFLKPFGVGKNSGNSTLNFNGLGLLFSSYQSDDGKVRFRYNNQQPMSIQFHPWANSLLFQVTDGSQPTPFGSEITSWKTAMKIMNLNGKVVIGETPTPGDYQLYVEKGILTEKIRLAVKNSSNWADYVFAPEYNLRSIPQLEEYIIKHGHLPNIPSTEEVSEKGIDLFEINSKLLEKIEELSLYVIELEKRITQLEK